MDRDQLADFLRTRRESLQPEDVGAVRGARRRTTGLRREEVAVLAGMSTDYYSRLEQRRGPQPSTQILSALARALRLDLPERDHLFRLAGHAAPDRLPTTDHVGPGIQRILDRLTDTPAQVVTPTGETLVQNPMAVALLGDQTSFAGLARSTVYRWYTDPASREVYPAEDHALRGAIFTAELRAAAAAGGPGSRATEIVTALLRESREFREVWDQHHVDEKHTQTKRFRHREIGALELECESLLDTETGQRLLVFTARAGSEDAAKLALLGVVGTQRLSTS